MKGWDTLVVLLVVVVLGGALFDGFTREPGKVKQSAVVEQINFPASPRRETSDAVNCSLPWAAWEARHQSALADHDKSGDRGCRREAERALLLFEAEFGRALDLCPRLRDGQ